MVIARIADGIMKIDRWLMSWRVLGRKVEEAILAQLVGHAEVATT